MTAEKRIDFHAFTIKHTGRVRRIITEVYISEAFDPAKHDSKLFTRLPFKALWDTGATGSVITPAVASTLGLTPTGQMTIQHAGGSSNNSSYVVNIGLPNNVNIAGVPVSECAAIAANFDAIIGMDIINMGDFAITNADAGTTMSYRIPPVASIDYVKDADRLKYAGVGRNAPCPCGQLDTAGKPVKFKRCHGRSA